MQKQRFSSQKIAQFEEAFKLCDKDCDGRVDTSVKIYQNQQLSILVRSLYQTPSNSQLKQWAHRVDPDRTGKFNFNKFLELMRSYILPQFSEYKEPQTEDQLIDAMKSIFKPSGNKISMKEFRNIMSNLGQKLSDDELNQLFKELKLQNAQNFNCQEFIKSILTR